jgi:hypothetical protein
MYTLYNKNQVLEIFQSPKRTAGIIIPVIRNRPAFVHTWLFSTFN